MSNIKRSRKSPAPKPTKATSPAPSRRRASQRARGIELKLGYPGKLRPLMIEQSRTEAGGYLTVYVGVRGEFLAAGVPPEFLPTAGAVKFEIRRQRGEGLLDATMSIIGVDRWELEIHWGDEMPYDAGHPAICELARMMLIDLGYWYRNRDAEEDLEYPIQELIADERAADFKRHNEAGSPKLQISSDFRKRLSEIAHNLFMQVHRYGEVFPAPLQEKKAEPQKSPLRIVVDNDGPK